METNKKELKVDEAVSLLSDLGFNFPKSFVEYLAATFDIPFRYRFGKLRFDRDELIEWCEFESLCKRYPTFEFLIGGHEEWFESGFSD